MPAHGWPKRSNPVDLDAGWMVDGACLPRTDLPWTADVHHLRPSDRTVMASVCADCPVLVLCDRFAAGARVTAGFRAGWARDEPRRRAVILPTDPMAEPGDSDDLGGAA
jgi:hypothetical protein